MNINELKEPAGIIPEVVDIAGLVKQVSGKDIDIRVVKDIATDALTKMARANASEHLMLINQSQLPRANHLIAHECCHILRIFAVDADKRLMSASDRDSMARAMREIEPEARRIIPAELIEKIMRFWIEGISMQLANLPVDASIEKWLFENYKGLRAHQAESMKAVADKALADLSKKIEGSVASKIFLSANAMAYAYLRATSEITGENHNKKFYDFPNILDVGKKLFNTIDVDKEDFNGDYATINKWAELLSIQDWFYWMDFEAVPSTYYADIRYQL